MRLRGWIAAIGVVAPLPLLVPRVGAQQPLRVVRHMPFDTIRVGDPIIVVFNRPVAPTVERAPDPVRFVRVEPTLSGSIRWRDPSTISIVPNALPPSGHHTITVGSTFSADDGARLEAPYVFTVHTSGPRYLGRLPAAPADLPDLFEPPGKVTLIYTAPVDTAALSRVARLELARSQTCPGGTVRFRVMSQRHASAAEARPLADGFENDTAQPYRTAVVLGPVVPMPEGCAGAWVVPSFDPNDRAEVRRRAVTSPPFRIASLDCIDPDCAVTPSFLLKFTASVRGDLLKRSIRVEPTTAFTIETHVESNDRWLIRLPVKMHTTYRVGVDSTLRDVYGRPLTGPPEIAKVIGDRRPAVRHEVGFFTLSRRHPFLRVTHVNVDSVDLAIVPIPDSLRTPVAAASMVVDSVARIVGGLRDTVHQALRLRAPPNVELATDIPIPPTVLARHAGSLLAIRVRAIRTTRGAADSADTRAFALVQVTDLLAHAKVEMAWGSVFVTDVNDGRPVDGASVMLRDARGRVTAGGMTDATGVVDLQRDPRWQPGPGASDREFGPWYPGIERYRLELTLVDVARGTDRSIMIASPHMQRSPLMDVVYPDFSFDRDRFVRAMVYTERPIYRPGEKVYPGTIVRQGWLGELTIPRDDSVRLRVQLDGYRVGETDAIRDTVLRLSKLGSAADSFSIPRRARLGGYVVRLDAVVEGSWRTVASSWFSVAEYRAAAFRVSAAFDTTLRFAGDTVRGHTEARYYFGAAMAGAEVRWDGYASDRRDGIAIPGLPDGFTIGNRSYDGPEPKWGGEHVSGVAKLDANGSAVIAIATKPGTVRGPAVLGVSFSVGDLDREWVTATASTPLHPASFYVAVRDPGRSWYWKQDVARPLEVVAVRPDGRRVRDAHVSVLIVRNRYVWSRAPNDFYDTPKWVVDTVGRDSVVTTDSVVRYRFTPRSSGSYQVVFTTRDERGRTTTTTVGRYVTASEAVVFPGRSLASLPLRVTPDTAAVGDTIAVRFVSPFKRAEAWVTLEREGILAERRLTVRGGETAVRFPVGERLIPGATVGVVLIDSTAAWRTDSVHRRIRSGHAAIQVDASLKKVRVAIEASRERYEPGDTARITVRLRDHVMRPALGEVTLWAVDESVLALANDESPDPYTVMYADRGPGLAFATMAATLAELGRNLRSAQWNISGNVSMMSAAAAVSQVALPLRQPRADFRTTAFFLAPLATDANGVVTAHVKLPDNVTTYRVIAVAATADSRFGAGVGSLLVTKPLLARSALPRFVRSGDELLAGAVITNQTGARATLDVRAAAKAATITGNSSVTRPLGPDSSAEVRFAWRIGAAPGDTAAFRLDVAGGGHGDAVLSSLPVRPPYSPRFHTLTGVARGATTVRMLLPRELDPARSRLTLSIGTTPMPILRGSYWRLRVYPYDCTEQITSAGVTIVAMLRLQRAGILDSSIAPRAADLRRELQVAVDALSRRVTYEGGIGYWGPETWTDARLTTYAGSLLLAARDLGSDVSGQTFESIASYLGREALAEPDTTYGVRADRERVLAEHLAQQLARLEYLRRTSDPDTTIERRIVGNESQMWWEDRPLLAELIAAGGDTVAARAVLARAWKSVETAGRRLDIPDSLVPATWFPSRVRPLARLLRATLALDSMNPGIASAIETIVQQDASSGGRVWNTHDYAAASEALAIGAIWQRSHEGAARTLEVRSARARGGHRGSPAGAPTIPHDSTISLGGLVERDGDWLALPLTIDAGDRAVYYSLTVEEIPVSAPTTPDARGVIVERWFERFDDGRPATEVKEGELVRGRLRVTLPSSREFLAVEDLLPAGLEVVDLSLRTSSTLAPFENDSTRAAKAAGDRENPGRSRFGTWYEDGWWSPWEHQEIRDDRVVYFARALEKGTYTATYVARATTAGTFIRPPAHAEEMYNPSLGGRSEGGTFRVTPR